mmetsp:Transcript_8658/g.19026  ORF Transcript_8658/g.19026 Transcript_8658/m.19026 type:complete len:220 (-) Transcript_8658:382-1041(-)
MCGLPPSSLSEVGINARMKTASSTSLLAAPPPSWAEPATPKSRARLLSSSCSASSSSCSASSSACSSSASKAARSCSASSSAPSAMEGDTAGPVMPSVSTSGPVPALTPCVPASVSARARVAVGASPPLTSLPRSLAVTKLYSPIFESTSSPFLAKNSVTLATSLRKKSLAKGWLSSTLWETSMITGRAPCHSRLYSDRSPCTRRHTWYMRRVSAQTVW